MGAQCGDTLFQRRMAREPTLPATALSAGDAERRDLRRQFAALAAQAFERRNHALTTGQIRGPRIGAALSGITHYL